jgi:hypothetical protein
MKSKNNLIMFQIEVWPLTHLRLHVKKAFSARKRLFAVDVYAFIWYTGRTKQALKNNLPSFFSPKKGISVNMRKESS